MGGEHTNLKCHFFFFTPSLVLCKCSRETEVHAPFVQNQKDLGCDSSLPLQNRDILIVVLYEALIRLAVEE